jgi:hypothetical protein
MQWYHDEDTGIFLKKAVLRSPDFSQGIQRFIRRLDCRVCIDALISVMEEVASWDKSIAR